MNDIICVLDIGSWSIKGVVAKLDRNFKINKIYSSSSRTIGLDRGKVTNLNYISDSIEKVVSELEDKISKNISRINICINGDYIKSYDSKGMVTISEFGSEIKQINIDKAIDSAKLLSIPMDRRILHIYKQGFRVDGQSEITMPFGMFGKKLEARLHIVTALENKVQSIIKAINNIGIQVGEIAFTGFMNIYGVLSKKHRKQGAIILDIGAGTMDFTAVKEGSFFRTNIFPFGSIDITEEIKRNFKIPFKISEKKKKEIISFYPDSDIENSNDKKLSYVIYDVLTRQLSEIKKDLDNDILSLASEKFVVTGATALMDGVIELMENIFDVKIEMGNPKILGNDSNVFFNLCHYSAAVGMVNFLVEKNTIIHKKTIGIIYSTFNKIKSFFNEYF